MHQELFFEQFNTFDHLLALLVVNIMQDSVLQAPGDMKGAVCDVAMLALTHEADNTYSSHCMPSAT